MKGWAGRRQRGVWTRTLSRGSAGNRAAPNSAWAHALGTVGRLHLPAPSPPPPPLPSSSGPSQQLHPLQCSGGRGSGGPLCSACTKVETLSWLPAYLPPVTRKKESWGSTHVISGRRTLLSSSVSL